MEENTEKAVESAKEVRGVPFKKGDDPRRNLDGRPQGSRNFATDFDEVVEEIAKDNSITKSEARKILLKVAYKNAKEGDYSFWRDIHDRLYGKPVQPTDITSQGERIIIMPAELINKNDTSSNTGNSSEGQPQI
jgi:hypothetical protein